MGFRAMVMIGVCSNHIPNQNPQPNDPIIHIVSERQVRSRPSPTLALSGEAPAVNTRTLHEGDIEVRKSAYCWHAIPFTLLTGGA